MVLSAATINASRPPSLTLVDCIERILYVFVAGRRVKRKVVALYNGDSGSAYIELAGNDGSNQTVAIFEDQVEIGERARRLRSTLHVVRIKP